MKVAIACLILLQVGILAASQDVESLCIFQGGKTGQANALWHENREELKFAQERRKVVIADLKGPGMITMIHFALPNGKTLNRDTILRIWWDGEAKPSVESPLVDFFCDPNGVLERVDTALVNKKRGWNAYFPMPFAKSARIELESESLAPDIVKANPCYSYVMYRSLESLPPNALYFHATWRQQSLLLGKEDYKVFEAQGKGQWVGWNMTVRRHNPSAKRYPVDENVKFYVDAEREPSIEWQGLEDGFGFSYGFPRDEQNVPQPNSFPYTGYQPYHDGAAAYRFNINDRITFDKSIRMTIGFGKNERPGFFTSNSAPGSELDFSSVAYWYQTEPHVPFPPLPRRQDRRPSNLPAGDNNAPQKQ